MGSNLDAIMNSYDFRATAVGNPNLNSPNAPQALRDFRLNGRKLSLKEVIPHLSDFAKDQYGSRLIQLKLSQPSTGISTNGGGGNTNGLDYEAEKQQMYLALKKKGVLFDLILDPFGNYVVQKFFEYCTMAQRRGLAQELVGNVLALSFHMQGCWVMQRALDFLEGPGNQEQLTLARELEGEVLRLVSNQNGNHVVQICIQKMPSHQVNFILEAFVGHANRMARHTYGCRVLQRLIEHCLPEQLEPLVGELVNEGGGLAELCQDEYGNYVVQSLAERVDAPFRDKLVDTLCEKALVFAGSEETDDEGDGLGYSEKSERSRLMNAIIGDDLDDDPPLYTMMKCRYANYILQKAVDLATGVHRRRIGERLKDQIAVLKQFTYGRHIVNALVRASLIDKHELQDFYCGEVAGA